MDWTPGDLLTAVRSLLGSYSPNMWTFEDVDLDGDQLLLTFRVDSAAPVSPAHGPDTRFGVHYSVADLPAGPTTGTPCDTPEEWAEEIKWTMDEQVETGGVGRAEHVPGPDGLVLLRWVW